MITVGNGVSLPGMIDRMVKAPSACCDVEIRRSWTCARKGFATLCPREPEGAERLHDREAPL